MTSSDWNVSAAPLFQKTNVLPFPELIKFEIANILYNYNNNCLPPSFDHDFTLAENSHSRMTRFSYQEQMVTVFLFIKQIVGKKRLNMLAPKSGIRFLWNSGSQTCRKYRTQQVSCKHTSNP